MSRREVGEESIRKIQRTGNKGLSYMITLPKKIIKNLGWKERQKVTVVEKNGKIIIEDWKE